MEMKNNNYKDYDTLKLFIKKDKAEDIVQKYQALQWEVVSQKENNKYEDIVDLEFVRPHKIANKDELQLLQVYMEEELNAIGKLDRYKNAKTTAAGLVVGSIGLLMMLFGIWINFSYSTVASLVVSLVMFVCGASCLGVELLFLPKMHKQEKQTYNQQRAEREQKLQTICDKINELGVNHGQDK